MYTEKIPWSEFSTYRDEVIIEIENKINEILTKSIYRNKSNRNKFMAKQNRLFIYLGV